MGRQDSGHYNDDEGLVRKQNFRGGTKSLVVPDKIRKGD
jgi:hypothetical protein